MVTVMVIRQMVCILSCRCTWEIGKALEKLEKHTVLPRASPTRACLSHQNQYCACQFLSSGLVSLASRFSEGLVRVTGNLHSRSVSPRVYRFEIFCFNKLEGLLCSVAPIMRARARLLESGSLKFNQALGETSS